MKRFAKLLLTVMIGVVTLPAYANQSHYESKLDTHFSSYWKDIKSNGWKDIHSHHNEHREDKSSSSTCTKCSENSLYALSDGDIQLTFLSSSAGFSDDLFLAGTSTNILNNHLATVGQVFTLSNIKAGAEVVFGLFVNNTGNKFYSGASSQNADGVIHAKFSALGQNTVKVSFEDLFGGGDRDYNDLIFSVSNVKIGNYCAVPVPEPESVLMIFAGLILIGFTKHRQAKATK